MEKCISINTDTILILTPLPMTLPKLVGKGLGSLKQIGLSDLPPSFQHHLPLLCNFNKFYFKKIFLSYSLLQCTSSSRMRLSDTHFLGKIKVFHQYYKIWWPLSSLLMMGGRRRGGGAESSAERTFTI